MALFYFILFYGIEGAGYPTRNADVRDMECLFHTQSTTIILQFNLEIVVLSTYSLSRMAII